MRRKRHWLLWLLTTFLISCVTVNIYFPAAAIQKAADQIVDEVRKTPEQKPEQKQEEKKDKTSFLEWLRFASFGPSEAHAAAVDVNVSTPAIRGLKASLATRFSQLQPLYNKGAVGETNNGLVAIRDIGALSLKEKADLNRLVDQENADRQALYTEIIKANNLDMGTMEELQRVFAKSWREKSSTGWWIQLDNGQWSKK